MTLKNFVLTCNNNTADIAIYDKHDNLLFEGMLYLVFHLDNRNEDQYNKAHFPFEERTSILESNVEAWELHNDNSLGIWIDYESGFKNKEE